MFTADSAWTVLAAIAFNLTRTAGVLASTFHARARSATIRVPLIAVPARIANRARSWLLHLPPQLALATGLGHALRRWRRSATSPGLTRGPCPDKKKTKWKGRTERHISPALIPNACSNPVPKPVHYIPETGSANPG